MKSVGFRFLAALIFFSAFWMSGASPCAAAADLALLKAKKGAEAKGYIFETNRDEIVAKAKT
jgi:hypothetical protein